MTLQLRLSVLCSTLFSLLAHSVSGGGGGGGGGGAPQPGEGPRPPGAAYDYNMQIHKNGVYIYTFPLSLFEVVGDGSTGCWSVCCHHSTVTVRSTLLSAIHVYGPSSTMHGTTDQTQMNAN